MRTVERFVTVCTVCFVIALLCPSLSSAQIDPESIVGLWLFDEGTGSIAKDNSGNGYDADLMENPNWVQGIRGQGLEFSGGGYLEIRNSAETLGFGGSATFTMTAWVSNQGGGTVIGKYNAGVIGAHFLQLDAAGIIGFDRETPPWIAYGSKAVPNNDFGHVAATYDGTTLRTYVNGELDIEQDWGPQSTDTVTPVLIGARHAGGAPTAFFNGVIDEVVIFNVALTQEQIRDVMKGNGLTSSKASAPLPEDESTDIPRDTLLAWTGTDTAVTHDVYFGTNWDDVNAASPDALLGVELSKGQTETTYAPEAVLGFGESYFWRVDEVNGAPDNTIFKGNIWSFTVEPVSYPITAVTATASSSHQATMGPEKTVDGSGLDALDHHSSQAADMWLSGAGVEPAWIQYEFDKSYKLHEMWVWNSNQLIESFIGMGAKDVVIEHSLDGVEWSALEQATQLTQAPGRSGYAVNNTIDLAGAVARFVRITVNSGYGMMPQYGLSEVRFYSIPTSAREPQPANGAVTNSTGVLLKWRAGREAVSHEINLGTDAADLALIATSAEAGYTASGLDYATTYFWSITEVNENETVPAYAGDVWSFTTPDYGTVDDFDQYDDNCNRIFFIWEDGLGHNGGAEIEDCAVPPSNGNGGGSIVGNDQAPFAERTIVNAGSSQSLPFNYDNAFGPSETTRSLPGQDWSASAIQTLSLAFSGAAGNTGQLYIKINNTKIVYEGELGKAQWLPWLIDLTAVTGLENVTSFTIGVDGANAAGMLYFDDIRLYPLPIELISPVNPDTAGLLVQYAFDEGSGEQATDASGQGNHGTVVGQPQWVAGVDGSAIFFDGMNDYVSAQKSLLSDLAQFTIACWIKTDMSSADRSGLVGQNDCVEYGFVSPDTLQIWTPGGGSLDYTWPYDDTDWHHVATVADGVSLTIYLDGRSVATGGTATANYGASTFPLNIAGNGVFDAMGNAFLGQLDDVRVYNRALSAEELAGLAGHTEALQRPF